VNFFPFHLMPCPDLSPPRLFLAATEAAGVTLSNTNDDPEREFPVPPAVRAWTGGVGSVPRSPRAEIPDAGHCLAFERPGIAAEVQGFLVGPA
jgi:hypothetical protein